MSRLFGFTAAACLVIFCQSLPGQDLFLTEFQTFNVTTLLDEDGEPSDWIEVYAAGPGPTQLAGWSLTDQADDPERWVFPEMELAPGAFLIVYASGKDRRDPDGPLHTNFKLSRGGEFLALVRPDGSLATFFGDEYPPQQYDASYGQTMDVEIRELVAVGASARVLVPQRRSELPDDWFVPGLDDSGWLEATTGLGYDSRAEPLYPAGVIQTDLQSLMQNTNASAFVRMDFDVADLAEVGTLTLRAQYDSGFVAYLNGVEVARANAGPVQAASRRGASEALEFETVALEVTPGLLQAGRNVLAFQALNDSPGSLDFLFVPVLESVSIRGVDPQAAHFAAPTPGLPNPTEGLSGLAEEPVASVASTHFTGVLQVALSAGSDDAVIRYTLDGNAPDENSLLYSGPLELTEVTRLRARNFEPGLVPSWYIQEDYLAIDESVRSFNSDLPLFVITTFGRGTANNAQRAMHMQVIDRGESGRASLDGPRHFIGHGLIKERGSSTRDLPKKSYGFEIQDRLGDDENVELLGLPEESDWVLQAPNTDLTLMRNAVAYELSRRIGRYAPRTVHCEVFVNAPGADGVRGPLSPVVTQEDYVGVYVLTEKIKRGDDRVDVDRLDRDHIEEPKVSGGYMLKIDPPDPDEPTILAGAHELNLIYPKVSEIASEQLDWIREYLNDMWDAMRVDFTEPVADISERAYASFIDVNSWLDHHILNEFTKNADGQKKSSYFSKREEEPIVYGPIWDMNLSMINDPGGWSGPRLYHWWGELFKDPVFLRAYVERYFEHREGALNSETIHGIVDGIAAQLQESHVRDFDRWEETFRRQGRGQRSVTEWEPEIEKLKRWVDVRFEWLDAELRSELALIDGGGLIVPGDLTQDNRLNLGDPVALITFLFTEGLVSLPCETPEGNFRLADANGDERMDVSDAVHLLNFLFLGGGPHVLGRDCVVVAECPAVCE